MTAAGDNYQRLVERYVASGDEQDLVLISAMGVDAVKQALPLEDIADMHHAALASLGALVQTPLGAERAAACLSEYLMAFSLAYRDRTQRMLDLQQIDSHRQKLEALGQLAAGVAHEFNNLLQPITSLAEMALEELEDDDMRETIAVILDAARQAACIVRHLLTSVRQMTPQAAPIPFGRTVRAAVDFLRRAMSRVSIEEEITDLDTPILGNAAELGQVVGNLIRNAADAMDGKGVVRVQASADPPEGVVRLHVQDTGVGMDKATVSRIFEPFFSTKMPGKGTGLGLTVVNGIVQAWKGAVEIDSVPGEGTTVSIVFPVFLKIDDQ